MIGESDAILLEPFTGGNRHRPALEKVLLVHQDEQNVIAARWRARGDNRRGRSRLLRRHSGRRGHRGGSQQSSATDHQRTAGGMEPVTKWIFHQPLRTRANWTVIGPVRLCRFKKFRRTRRRPIYRRRIVVAFWRQTCARSTSLIAAASIQSVATLVSSKG